MRLLHFASLLILFTVAKSLKFPNDVMGSPTIDCGMETISISVETSDAVASRIFAKGQSGKDSCYFENTNNATFTLSQCNMNRQRQISPKGLAYSIVVVVQLHPHFITKVDRAYHLRCFYMETDKSVTASLDVSMMTTQSIQFGAEMPQCLYNLRSGGPNGASVKYASIGDKVWHVWECPSDIYGMLVHSCFVTDGAGNKIQILDEMGCGVDDYVMRTPIYANDLTSAQQETHVFKFADKISVGFNCQIRLCVKSQDGCKDISPPPCSAPGANNERLVSVPTGVTELQPPSQNDATIQSQPSSKDQLTPSPTKSQGEPLKSTSITQAQDDPISSSTEEDFSANITSILETNGTMLQVEQNETDTSLFMEIGSLESASKTTQPKPDPALNSIAPTSVDVDSQTKTDDPMASEALMPVRNEKNILTNELKKSMLNLLEINDTALIGSGEEPLELTIARDQPLYDGYLERSRSAFLNTPNKHRVVPSLTRRSLALGDDPLELDIDQEMFVLEANERNDGRIDAALSLEEEESFEIDGVCLDQRMLIAMIFVSVLIFFVCTGLLLCLCLKSKGGATVAASVAGDSEHCFKDARSEWQSFYATRRPFMNYGFRR